MIPSSVHHLPLATGQALFGSQWLALLAVIACIAVFILAVAGVGRWLAATHPEAPPRPAVVPDAPQVMEDEEEHIPPEVVIVIAAAVSSLLGPRARISAVELSKHPPSVEALMQQWSLEGRRQIYSSHKVR